MSYRALDAVIIVLLFLSHILTNAKVNDLRGIYELEIKAVSTYINQLEEEFILLKMGEEEYE